MFSFFSYLACLPVGVCRDFLSSSSCLSVFLLVKRKCTRARVKQLLFQGPTVSSLARDWLLDVGLCLTVSTPPSSPCKFTCKATAGVNPLLS